MSKAVLISIRPKWCEKIANGKKTIEVRKTKPKLETPFKCYIYCTLPKYPHEDFIATDYPRPQFYGGGKVIGEFTCDRIYKIDKDSTDFLFKFGRLSVYKQAAEEKCGLCVAMTDDELHGYLGHCQGSALNCKDPEADVRQEHMDRVLKEIIRDKAELIPHAERYKDLRKVTYGGRK